MGRKFFNEIMKAYVYPDRVVMGIAVLIVLFHSTMWGLLCILLIAVDIFYHGWLNMNYVDDRLRVFEGNFQREQDAIHASYADGSPQILCVADSQAKIHWYNRSFELLFGDAEGAEDVITKNFIRPFFEKPYYQREFSFEGKFFKISSAPLEAEPDRIMLFWQNVTGREVMKRLYKKSRACVGFINVDNFDELLASAETEDQATMTAEIDRVLQTWASGFDASIIRVRSSRYYLLFEEQYLEKLAREDFDILQKVHEIASGADFPTSVSIGIGVGGPSMAELQKDALDALELALGRGGDQAVVQRHGSDTEFYGGALTTVEKRNKGRSRIMAHALIQQMSQSDRVLVMGHKNPDLDSYGAAVGIYALAEKCEKPCDIVLDAPGDAVEIIHEEAIKTGLFSYKTSAEALACVTGATLLVVVDAHIPYITECPELISAVKRVVVIDHHRKSKDSIEDPTLAYMESYASSASELVTEILQYSGDRDSYDKFQMEALLAGIVVDTKSFTINAGVRTFEAAAWLRRAGADNAQVKAFFKQSIDFYRKKANIIASAELVGGGIAVAYTRDEDPSMQILVSQAADELLNLKGVEAAFAAGPVPAGTAVSARSLGHINVQTIMESLGGGGHVNVAAAQLGCLPEEAINDIVQKLRESGML